MIGAPRGLNAVKENALARYSFVSGIVGAIAIVLLGYLGARYDSLNQGLSLHSLRIAENFKGYALFALSVCGMLMLAIEIVIRKRVEKDIFALSPKLREGKFVAFALECLLKYLFDLAILGLAVGFYLHAREYGFARKAAYYQPWFFVLEIFWKGYLLGGFPYVVLTRALQHLPEGDRKEPAYLLLKAVMRLLRGTFLAKALERTAFMGFDKDPGFSKFTSLDKTCLLGLFVKMFFVPLMTVFFLDQFQHLVKNWSAVIDAVESGLWDGILSTAKIYQISFSLIFSIDVGVAWCGYVITSRWVRNGNVSVEPTFLGWFVALSCYPPFKSPMSVYFKIPDESGFLAMGHPWLVAMFAAMSLASFLVYMLSTVCFGLRFSNLTHRGVIRRGPYAWVRHPAYASKNFSWWCVMMPSALYDAIAEQNVDYLLQMLGLILMTYFYFWRALTEERHLSADPDYVDYCRQVPYRFIPGVL